MLKWTHCQLPSASAQASSSSTASSYLLVLSCFICFQKAPHQSTLWFIQLIMENVNEWHLHACETFHCRFSVSHLDRTWQKICSSRSNHSTDFMSSSQTYMHNGSTTDPNRCIKRCKMEPALNFMLRGTLIL